MSDGIYLIFSLYVKLKMEGVKMAVWDSLRKPMQLDVEKLMMGAYAVQESFKKLEKGWQKFSDDYHDVSITVNVETGARFHKALDENLATYVDAVTVMNESAIKNFDYTTVEAADAEFNKNILEQIALMEARQDIRQKGFKFLSSGDMDPRADDSLRDDCLTALKQLREGGVDLEYTIQTDKVFGFVALINELTTGLRVAKAPDLKKQTAGLMQQYGYLAKAKQYVGPISDNVAAGILAN